MIRPEEVFPIGRLTRTHGVQGEMELQFTDDAFDRGSAPYVVLLLDGIFVPFFIEEYRFKNREAALLRFEEIHDEAQARRLVGVEVFYPYSAVEDAPLEEIRSLKAFVGYTILLPDVEESSDEALATRELGTVTHVAETASNAVFTVEGEGDSVLIPFHSDFLIDMNPRERYLVLQLPEGILDLNL